MSDFDPLTHALAVLADLLVNDIRKTDEVENMQCPSTRLIPRHAV